MTSLLATGGLRMIYDEDWSAIAAIQEACYPPAALEAIETLRSHARISPATCLVAYDRERVVGYFLSHPWPRRQLPPLNEVYSVVPPGADTLFLHDLAVLPDERGRGWAAALVDRVLAAGHAAGFRRAELISVQGSQPFWSRWGFVKWEPVPAEYQQAVQRFYPDGGVACMNLEWGQNPPVCGDFAS